jgi:hypothetical protein
MANVDKLIGQKTDLDLNTSGVLPQAPTDVGMDVDSLSGVTTKALSVGYEDGASFDPDHPDFCGDALQDTTKRDTTCQGSPADGGFLGRPAGFQR